MILFEIYNFSPTFSTWTTFRLLLNNFWKHTTPPSCKIRQGYLISIMTRVSWPTMEVSSKESRILLKKYNHLVSRPFNIKLRTRMFKRDLLQTAYLFSSLEPCVWIMRTLLNSLKFLMYVPMVKEASIAIMIYLA